MWDINHPYPPQEDFTCHRLDGPSTPTRRSPRRIGSRWSALRVSVGLRVAGTGWRVMLSAVLGLRSWLGW